MEQIKEQDKGQDKDQKPEFLLKDVQIPNIFTDLLGGSWQLIFVFVTSGLFFCLVSAISISYFFKTTVDPYDTWNSPGDIWIEIIKDEPLWPIVSTICFVIPVCIWLCAIIEQLVKAKKDIARKLKKHWILTLCAALILTGLPVYAIYWYNHKYDPIYLEAVQEIKDENYREAVRILETLPKGYEDRENLIHLCRAELDLQAQNYREAIYEIECIQEPLKRDDMERIHLALSEELEVIYNRLKRIWEYRPPSRNR